MSFDQNQLETMRRLHNLLRKDSPLNNINGETVYLPFEVLFPFTQATQATQATKTPPPMDDHENDHEGFLEEPVASPQK